MAYTNVKTATQLWIGLSHEPKPRVEDDIGRIEIGARLIELDTGREFIYYSLGSNYPAGEFTGNRNDAAAKGGQWYAWPSTDPALVKLGNAILQILEQVRVGTDRL